MSQFSNLVRVGKATHKACVIKTQAGAIAEAGWPGRKLQVKGSDPVKAVEIFRAQGFKVVKKLSTETVTVLTYNAPRHEPRASGRSACLAQRVQVNAQLVKHLDRAVSSGGNTPRPRNRCA